jgi:hypothetical protein
MSKSVEVWHMILAFLLQRIGYFAQPAATQAPLNCFQAFDHWLDNTSTSRAEARKPLFQVSGFSFGLRQHGFLRTDGCFELVNSPCTFFQTIILPGARLLVRRRALDIQDRA